MAILLYSNGLTEEYKPINKTFTETEILGFFNEFNSVKTTRIPSMLNTWCIYGVGDNDPTEFNKMAVVLLKSKTPIFSHLMFIHDSEINPEWKLTDDILYHDYNNFILSLKKFIDETAERVIDELTANAEYEGKTESLPQLLTIGTTPDKKIIFAYNPDEQSSAFYENEEFYKFSQKVYEYLATNKQNKEPFTIYEDKKAVIIVEKEKVDKFFTKMLHKFQSKEDYEICTNISIMMKSWNSGGVIDKPKRKRRSKKSDASTNLTGTDEQ